MVVPLRLRSGYIPRKCGRNCEDLFTFVNIIYSVFLDASFLLQRTLGEDCVKALNDVNGMTFISQHSAGLCKTHPSHEYLVRKTIIHNLIRFIRSGCWRCQWLVHWCAQGPFHVHGRTPRSRLRFHVAPRTDYRFGSRALGSLWGAFFQGYWSLQVNPSCLFEEK